jgi:hypothetical protein
MMKFKRELVICQRTQNCTIMPTRHSLFNYNANLFLNTQLPLSLMFIIIYSTTPLTESVEYLYTINTHLLYNAVIQPFNRIVYFLNTDYFYNTNLPKCLST